MGFFGKDNKVELETLQKTVSTLTTENESLKKQVESLKKEKQQHIDALKGAINKKVNQTLAGMGVDSFVPEEICEVQYNTPVDILKKWQSLSGYEKGQFFKENESVITQTRQYFQKKQV